jgi:hypothetical protein
MEEPAGGHQAGKYRPSSALGCGLKIYSIKQCKSIFGSQALAMVGLGFIGWWLDAGSGMELLLVMFTPTSAAGRKQHN